MNHKEDTTSSGLTVNKSVLPGEWLLYFIAIVGALISLLLWYASVLQSHAELQRTLRVQTEHVVNDIKLQFQLRIAALNHMGSHLSEGEEPSLLNWQTNVVSFINDYGAFEAIAYADSALQERWVFPNILANQQLYAEFIRNYSDKILTINTQHAVLLSDGVNIGPHEMGIFIVVPLFGNTDDSKGYLISLVNMEKALNIEVDSDDYIVEIFDESKRIYFKPSDNKASVVRPE